MARVFISRDLPFPALDRLKEQHDVDIWEERTPLFTTTLVQVLVRQGDRHVVEDTVDAAGA